jgi:hypothetical protein
MAAAYLCPIGLMLQAFTNAGAVLASGKVNTYQPGTTTAVTTYTDNTLGTANANPIILDSHGRLPASVWVQRWLRYFGHRCKWISGRALL